MVKSDCRTLRGRVEAYGMSVSVWLRYQIGYFDETAKKSG